MAAQQQDMQQIATQMKAILERIAQAKNNPQEVQRAVDEGKQQLEQQQAGQQPDPNADKAERRRS
jgi:uncharacterized protein (UPF0147 family)